MSTFFRVYILQIPWGNPSFKDFAGVVFYHFDLGINRSQLAVLKIHGFEIHGIFFAKLTVSHEVLLYIFFSKRLSERAAPASRPKATGVGAAAYF